MKRALLALAACVALQGQTSSFGLPIVTVYPFTAGSGIDSATGGKLALTIGARLHDKKDLDVKAPPAGSTRDKYLETARTLGADYYVTGYVTPLGDDVTLVVQLVSTTTGILVWSDTASVRTYGEAGAQADRIHDVIIARSGGSSLNRIPVPTPSPKPPPGLSPAQTPKPR